MVCVATLEPAPNGLYLHYLHISVRRSEQVIKRNRLYHLYPALAAITIEYPASLSIDDCPTVRLSDLKSSWQFSSLSGRQQTASLIAALMMCQEATWQTQTPSRARAEARVDYEVPPAHPLIHPLTRSSAQLAQHSVMMAIIARFSNNLYEILQLATPPTLRTRHFLFAPIWQRPTSIAGLLWLPQLRASRHERLHLESEQQ